VAAALLSGVVGVDVLDVVAHVANEIARVTSSLSFRRLLHALLLRGIQHSDTTVR